MSWLQTFASAALGPAMPGASVAMWALDAMAGPDRRDAATARGGAQLEAGDSSLLGRMAQTVGDFGRGVSQEGLSGLLDHTGMMDRQAAQRELSSRFQVVADDSDGPRNHNQVTQAEYEQIARTFSDVRLGRGDLTIDTSGITDEAQAQEYRDGTMIAIADMMMTTSGRRRINDLSDNVLRDDGGNRQYDEDGEPIHRRTTIRPLFHDENENHDFTDDPTTRADYFNENAHTAVRGAAEVPDTDIPDDVWERNDQRFRNADTGERGRGSDMTIWWNPTARVDECSRADVILAHEMDHAWHGTQGTTAAGTYIDWVGDDPDSEVVANSERQTVGLSRSDSPTGGHYPGDADGCTENTYRLERNQLGLGDRFAMRTSYDRGMPGMVP